MFELSKHILQKVSFDSKLFRKELTKALAWLKTEEKLMLRVWCLSTFGHMYKDMIMEVFKSVAKV
jgi:hypothetical protein